ncbi:hypothetical protein XnspCFBP7698_11880 [Xanthomonas sp. CFBP 7698]|nr:hypothetical protein XnspCFBP7698_11880 [Xanthomonas sp. CFBP 7698]
MRSLLSPGGGLNWAARERRFLFVCVRSTLAWQLAAHQLAAACWAGWSRQAGQAARDLQTAF